jgi:hypothetical protein
VIERSKIRIVHRIVSFLPAATEIAAELGLMDQVVGVSHECDFPDEANQRPRITHCPVHNTSFASREVDEWVRWALHDNGTIYTIDEPLLRKLQPDVIPHPKIVRRLRSRLRHCGQACANFARSASGGEPRANKFG